MFYLYNVHMIIPGILEKDWLDIKDKIDIVHNRNLSQSEKVNRIQIDFCDGLYVQSQTWSPLRNDAGTEQGVKYILESGLPYWEELDYEADLMVSDLLAYIDKVSELGFTHVILHSEDELSLKEAILHAKELMLNVGISSRNMKVIENVITSRDILSGDMIENIDYIQIMGIANIGYQHQEFDMSTIDKINIIKTTLDQIVKDMKISRIIKIQIDGGMNSETSRLCLDAGARNIVMGSAYFRN